MTQVRICRSNSHYLRTACGDGIFQAVIENHSGFTQTLDAGTAVVVKEVVNPQAPTRCKAVVKKVEVSPSKVEWRKQMFSSLLTVGDKGLKQMLLLYHHTFSVEEDEHGSSVLCQHGDAPSKKQLPRRILLLQDKKWPNS